MDVSRVKHAVFTPVEKAPEPDLGTDPIPIERYISPEFMEKEWDNIWTKVWLMGALESDLPDPGDYVVTELGRESILITRGSDRKLRAFYNICQHRANQIRECGIGHAESFKCAYHHWEWTIDGEVKNIPDSHDFPQGTPADLLRLQEIPCDTWGGMVWYNMDTECGSLQDYLGVIPGHLDAYHFEKMTLVNDVTAEWFCNWKASVDAFNETYHVQGIHPQLMWYIDDVHVQTDLYERHNRYLVPFACLSPRLDGDDAEEVNDGLKEMMAGAGMNTDAYEGTADTVRRDMQLFKREHGKEQGYDYSELNDDQLTDDYHYFVFPNITMNIHADSMMLFRQRPHPTDPDKMYFDIMNFTMIPKGEDKPDRPTLQKTVHGKDSLGLVVDQDAFNLPRVQRGMHSRGFNKGLWIPFQERRIRHFHKTISDYVGE